MTLSNEQEQAVPTTREQRLEEALRASVTALDDWLHLYAGDMCDQKGVEAARQRVGRVGMIGYVSLIQQANQVALEQAPMMGGTPVAKEIRL